MKYVSTRGAAPVLPFDDVLLTGLARDGGLYVPQSWPRMMPSDMAALAGRSYTDVAYQVIRPFVAGSITDDDLGDIIEAAYGNFDHPDVAPLIDLGGGEWIMELFHGPTLAFKDYAMQFLGRMFEHVLKVRDERVTIVAATSGDTGSAAIEACRDRDAIEIFVLHPKGRVSEVQRRQMTTVMSDNVHNIAIEGSFDDCQDMVKAMFNDQDFRDRHNLSAVNSINWARIVAQVVYYFRAAVELGAPEQKVSFAVPTGNFGNVFAGYAAHRMGLPISQLVMGSNSNDILTRFFDSGRMEMTGVAPTISPSMDIQVSSNFERLLFELYDRDGDRVAKTLESFRAKGVYEIDADTLAVARQLFAGARFDDDQTRALIGEHYKQTGTLIDPHSAVGLAAARACRRDPSQPMVTLATAHPAKFPGAVEDATGVKPQLPPHLADLFERSERLEVLPNDLEQVQDFINRKQAT